MDIQSAISECDMAHSILIALISYKKNPHPSEVVAQSLTFAAESCLARAISAINTDLNVTTSSAGNLRTIT